MNQFKFICLFVEPLILLAEATDYHPIVGMIALPVWGWFCLCLVEWKMEAESSRSELLKPDPKNCDICETHEPLVRSFDFWESGSKNSVV